MNLVLFSDESLDEEDELTRGWTPLYLPLFSDESLDEEDEGAGVLEATADDQLETEHHS